MIVLDASAKTMLDQIVGSHEESGAAVVYGRLDEGEAGDVRLLVQQGYAMAVPFGALTPESYVVPTPLGRDLTSQPQPAKTKSKRAKK